MDVFKIPFDKLDNLTNDQLWTLLRRNRINIPRKEGLTKQKRYYYIIANLIFQNIPSQDKTIEQINKCFKDVINSKSRFRSYMVKNNK